MRSAASSRRKRSALLTALQVGPAILLAAGGIVASLWALGLVDLTFGKKKPAPTPPPSGVPVPLSARAIPAYTLIVREHFVNARTGEFEVGYFPEEPVKRFGYITDIGQLLGRGLVLSHDKAPGYAFTEKDFFPEQTRSGVVAGIPPEKRAFLVPADKIIGIQNLKRGDHFDMVATLPVDFEKGLPRNQILGLPNALAMEQLSGLQLPKRASSKVLVQNGIIILPMAVREVPLASPSSNNPNERPKTKPVQEATVAVDPSEVTQLSEALAVHAEVICVGRSGRPEDSGTSVTRSAMASPGVRTVETIVGGKRHVLVFPKPGQGPAAVMVEPEPSGEPGIKESAKAVK